MKEGCKTLNNVAKRIKIDLYSPTSYEVIKAQQGDNNSRVIEFELYDQEKPYTISNNVSIKMEGHRGDNSYFQPKDCTVTDNIITVTLDSDVLYEAGTVEAKIVMTNTSDSSILSTIPFKIHVQKNPCDKNKIESEKSSVIDWLVLNLNKLKTSFEEQASDLKSHLEDNVHHITASERANWDDAHNKSHKHSNLPILNKITQSLLDNWNAAYTHISDAVKHITSSERTLWNTVSNKVDKIEGKGLSTNDYTDADKNIVASMSSGAVTGIKGNEESTYRTGNVNITPANIGAVSKSGDTISGDLRLKGSGNFGNKLNFGDGDLVHLHEYEDDKLEIKASTLRLTSSNNILADKPIAGDITGNAATATKATQDGDGNNIVNTYLKNTNITPFSGQWFNVSNGTYKFLPMDGKLVSNNKGVANSTAESSWMAYFASSASFTLKYRVSSESNCDKLTITLDGSMIVNEISGNGSELTYSGTLSTGVHTLYAKYTKDVSVNSNEDCAFLEFANVLVQCSDIPTSLPANGGTADNATKATQDGNGNNIADTYWNKDRDLIVTRTLTLSQMTLAGNYDGYTTGTVSALTNLFLLLVN